MTTTTRSNAGYHRRRRLILVRLIADDFAFAPRADPCHCPVANAIHRITRQGCHVGTYYAQVGRDGFFALPPVATQFILNYDQHGTRDLVSFTLKPITKDEANDLFKKVK